MRNKFRYYLLFILVFLSTGLNSQVCPLNTPEFPFTTDDNWTLYSWSSNLYMPSQVGGAQTLTSISFRLDSDASGGNYTYNDIRVYMRHTAVTNFASDPGYPGTGGFTQVYSGNMTFNGTGTYAFTFNVAASFAYNGTDQLEVLFENRGGSDNTAEEPWFDRTDDAGVGVYSGKVGWGGSWASATGISSNRRFNLRINGVACTGFPLPVELISSELNCLENVSELTWEVASELNNDYYTILSSENGKQWSESLEVEGAGTLNNKKKYTVRLPKANYYKLTQTDYDGTVNLLNTFSNYCSDDGKLVIYPNPVHDDLHILVKHPIDDDEIRLFNSYGQPVSSKILRNDSNHMKLDASDLIPGLYVIQVYEKGEWISRKIVVQ